MCAPRRQAGRQAGQPSFLAGSRPGVGRSQPSRPDPVPPAGMRGGWLRSRELSRFVGVIQNRKEKGRGGGRNSVAVAPFLEIPRKMFPGHLRRRRTRAKKTLVSALAVGTHRAPHSGTFSLKALGPGGPQKCLSFLCSRASPLKVALG